MDPILIVVLIVIALVVVVGGYFFVRSRQGPTEEPYYHFNCPGCRRKLRYRARQAGHAGMCPRCNKACTFPAVPRD